MLFYSMGVILQMHSVLTIPAISSVSDYFVVGDTHLFASLLLLSGAFILEYKGMASLTILITSAQNKTLPPMCFSHTCALTSVCKQAPQPARLIVLTLH